MQAKSSVYRHIPVAHGGASFLQKGTDSGIIDFSSNVSPAGIPSLVKKSLKKSIDDIMRYPDPDSSKVVLSLARYTGMDSSNILVGNGAIEIIYNFCLAFLSKNTRVLIPVPTFQEYEAATLLNDCKVVFFKTMDLSCDFDQFVSKIPRDGCVFICNPNNPTGKLLKKDLLLNIVRAAKKVSATVFVDECFIEMVPGSNESVIPHVKRFSNLLVLRSLTKSFGLAGIRIGYAVGPAPVIKILRKIKVPWSVNGIAQNAACAALKDRKHLDRSNRIIKKELNYLATKINGLDGFDCYESSTNFILIRTRDSSTVLQKRLLEQRVLVRDCKNFRGLDNHHIRIAVKSHAENLKLVKALVRIS